ncbi:Uncharacterized conserved protein, MAPEG superfamily [Paracoccus halophilus]|uniref:Membrane protein n=1 Tax=Paracoccus halophilus TaxID=376733 RepID=A0A099F7T2_9RHOB|nr:MAPEG family protein [Paracoccus halophilus]KGJ06770.1 membrane protein [Paracoccus halophilus]SFA41696.1 Uncharacterized conserved protein, MAPEG superfamily [Paracoccus halophilus]
MAAETTALALAALLQAAQICAVAIATNRDAGVKWNAGPRDTQPEFAEVTGRWRRAMQNHFEGLILFTIAVVVVVTGDATSPVTVFCSWLYLLARLLYVPAYVLGWSPWRSVIWAVGFFATMVMIVTGLL